MPRLYATPVGDTCLEHLPWEGFKSHAEENAQANSVDSYKCKGAEAEVTGPFQSS